ncbi:hypothetical protein K8R78_04210, partial [bacterium]|nr:hypothetical protein [bacterium]
MRRLTGLLLILIVMVGVVEAAPEWHIETVDSVPGDSIDGYNSLTLDSTDRPHITYFLASDALRYARLDGSAWQTETVDSEGWAAGDSSLALDSSENPHISYQEGENGDLRYARWDGSAWQTETVDSEEWVSAYNSLALDTADRPHISYRDSTNLDLKYAHWDGSAWQVETVDSEGYMGL